ncbi:MAG TPA: hypothetical protein VFY03_04060, partial [Woeseiaceae bacterium]|nr:hypothetical protein [Woeseiaceae bacterium]
YAGAPAGWANNTILSGPLADLGAADDFEVAWTVASDPSAATWILGLGVGESGADWRDVDYAFRGANGSLAVYEGGTWRTNVAPLVVGDRLSIAVRGSELEYRMNGVKVFATPIAPGTAFYIDSSFKSGAIQMGGFTLLIP